MTAYMVQNLFSPPNAQTADSIDLLWDKPPVDPAEPEVSPLYQIYCDGQWMGETAKGCFTATGLQPGRSYTFTVRIKDADGCLYEPCEPVTVATKLPGTVLDIRDFGAVGDGTTLNTQAIQKAVEACPPGGTVLIPEGTYISGPIFLKSNMTLKVDKGGILKGSEKVEDYKPLIPCRFEGFEMNCFPSLINAGKRDSRGPANVTNLTICGEGTIDGSGRFLGPAQKEDSGNRSRGRTICLMNCENVLIQGLHISYAPAWTIHLIYCSKVSLSGLKIVSKNPEYRIPNGDGIDPDSSTDVYIYNCWFRTGDDSIAVKSGKNLEGYQVGRPTENVRISDCIIDGSHGGIVIGSEMSGSVRNVRIRDCEIRDIHWEGLDIKSNIVRGGTVEDVEFRDCILENMRQAIRVTTNYSVNNDGTPAPYPPVIRNVRFDNIRCNGGARIALTVIGQENSIVKSITFRNVSLSAETGAVIRYGENIIFDNVKVETQKEPDFDIDGSAEVKWVNPLTPGDC